MQGLFPKVQHGLAGNNLIGFPTKMCRHARSANCIHLSLLAASWQHCPILARTLSYLGLDLHTVLLWLG